MDYIGIADDLKKALSIYSSDIRKQAMIPIGLLVEKMLEKYETVKNMFVGVDFSGWRKVEGGALAILFQEAINAIITDVRTGNLLEERKDEFLRNAEHLFKIFALVMPHHEANAIRSDVEFFQAVKIAIIKRLSVDMPLNFDMEVESAVRDLVSKSIVAEGVIDIFAQRGKAAPNISIFDEQFLEEVKNMRFKNVAVEVLKKLLEDELRGRMKKNLIRFHSLMELLEHIIEEYENNIISSANVIERLIELARQIKSSEQAGGNLGLSEEEVAFYDALFGR